MGLPIEKLGGGHEPERHPAPGAFDGRFTSPMASPPLISPSMDIQVSSNFERALFDAYGRDGAAVAQLMDELKQGAAASTSRKGRWKACASDFASGAARPRRKPPPRLPAHLPQMGGEFALAPHSRRRRACGPRLPRSTPMVSRSPQAHPAKFPDAVRGGDRYPPRVPPRMADLHERPERMTRVENDLHQIETLIREEIAA